MEQTREREWKSLVCPEGKGRGAVMLEWDVVSEKGRIFKRVLKQIDCHSPQLTLFGGAECSWSCEEVITKRER